MMNTLYCLLNIFWVLIKILRFGDMRKVAVENIMLRVSGELVIFYILTRSS